MVSCSDFAYGICLGRSSNNKFYWVGNWGQQHYRSRHNSEQHVDSQLSEQHCCRNTRRGRWSSRCGSRSNERDDGWTINHNHPRQ